MASDAQIGTDKGRSFYRAYTHQYADSVEICGVQDNVNESASFV